MSRLLALFFAIVALSAGETLLWIEGEAPATGRGQPHSWYSGQVKKELLSGGDFLSSFTERGPTEVDYAVTVPAAGRFALWARVNPVQAALSWRRDGGPWQAVDLSRAVDRVNLAADGKPDLRFLAWVPIAELDLPAGALRVGFRFHSANHHHGALDCFVLTDGPFTPDGKSRPGAVLTDAAPGWFAFAPGIDRFAADALLDLRSLNEKRAGERGWLAARGDDLVMPDGTPIRLWGVNAMSDEGEAAARYLYARLAKSGVNAVRFHGLLADRSGRDPAAVSAEALARLHLNARLAAEHGIYIHLSTYFPLWLKLRAEDGIEGGALGEHPFGLLLIEPRFQALYKSWAKQVLTTPDPATGRSLAQDPAVTFWEIQNEDSLFFWTATREKLGEGPWRRLGERFAQWAVKRHGSLAKALAAWGTRHPDDDAAAPRLGLFGPWEMTGKGLAQAPARRARVADQARFYAELTHAVYSDLAAFLRAECGFKGIITASNWKTADDAVLGLIERWTYTAGDAIDRHGYFGGRHEGEASGWSVRPGHAFADRAAVDDLARTPLAWTSLVGKPHLITEIAWNRPNRFTADAPLLIAATSAVQGADGVFLFALRRGTWQGDGADKWPLATPGGMGQWPAAALMYRRGDLAPVMPAKRMVGIDDLLALAGPGLAEGRNADARAEDGDGGVGEALAGGALIELRPGRTPSATPGPRVEVSQVRWDRARGVVTVDASRSQAATGHLSKAGAIKLTDVTIRSGNAYGAVQVISLDGEPLARSRRILVSAFSEERLYGFRVEDGRIVDTGRAPINVRDLDVEVVFAAPVGRAIALDGHGQAAGEIVLQGSTLRLPRDRLQAVVTR